MDTKQTGPGWVPEGFSRLFLAGILFLLTAAGMAGAQQGEISATATQEVLRRQQMLEAAQKMITAGAQAQADRSYGEAMDRFKAAFEMLPEAPAVQATRTAVFRRYQSATVQFAQQKIDEARWQEAEQALQVAIDLGKESGMPPSSLDPGVERMLERLNDPDYYTRAITPRHLQDVENVKKFLILAKGYLDYGNYDQALASYQKALAIDPYNKAARRGMEEVERHILNYAEVARDQTRATYLRQIAEGWEMPVPHAVDVDTLFPDERIASGRRTEIENKLKTIIIPSLEFQDARLSDVLELLNQRSVELDFNEPKPDLKGVNLLIDSGTFGAGENPGDRPLSLRLTNVPLGAALDYVTRQVNATYRVDDYAVSIVSLAAGAQEVLDTRTWTVPPGFLERGDAAGAAALNNDPFAAPAAPGGGLGGGVLVKRKTAKEFLEENGITFGPGAIANYNAATSKLMVRNTPTQLRIIDGLVQTAREGVNKMVEVGLRIMTVSQEELKTNGMDWLLGQTNLGTVPKLFFGGGTDGTAPIPTSGVDFPFNTPGGGPVGTFPVTRGLRTGDLAALQTIDDVIGREIGARASLAPATFSVAGVFTDPQFQATWRGFRQLSGADTICATKLLIRPGQRGKIEVMREFIYPTEYDPPEIPQTFGFVPVGQNVIAQSPTDQLPVVPAQPTAFEMRPLGKVVEVEPTVGGDNLTVNVDVLVDMSEFVGFINYGEPIRNSFAFVQGNPDGSFTLPEATPNRILMPVFDAVRETTNVTVWDGQTIAIGGLYGHSVTDSEDKVPFAGDLPVFGRLFRSTTDTHRKRAMIIFLSVRLIDPGGQPINDRLEGDEPNNVRPFEPQVTSRTPVAVPPPSSGGVAEK